MRIISQLGDIDMPYENVSVFICKLGNGYTIEVSRSDYSAAQLMANYSALEKAKKAMELLQQAYTGRYITNTDIPSEDFDKTMHELMKHGFGTVIVRDAGDSRVEFDNLNGYFKFPKDEDIEVDK